jgi:hypothetical protein
LAFIPAQNAIITVDQSISDDVAEATIDRIDLTGKRRTIRTLKYAAEGILQHAIDDAIEQQAANLLKYRAKYFSPAQARKLYSEAYSDVRYQAGSACGEGAVPVTEAQEQRAALQAPIDELVAGNDGAVWVRRGSFGKTASEWTVLDPTGSILATVMLPAATRVMAVTRSSAWASVLGDNDVSYVVRYDLK